MGRFLRLAAFAGLVLFALALAWGLRNYPGMTTRMPDHWRDATWTESMNLGRCILYWVDFMQELRPDPVARAWRFPPPEAEAANERECLLEYHRGRFPQAVACLDRVIAAEGEDADKLFWLAFSLMRQAEAENCLAGLQAASPEAGAGQAHEGLHAGHGAYCVLPVERPHTHQAPGRRATEVLTRALDRQGGDDALLLWLLNVNVMALGAWPQEVPERYRLDTAFTRAFYGPEAAAARARHADLAFTDRAGELGLAVMDSGRGVAVEDFDGDGFLDLATAGGYETLRFFHNDAGQGFRDVTEAVGLGAVTQPFSVTAADYDDDGAMDLFVARPFDRYQLFRNLGQGSFEDVSESSGLAAAHKADEVAASWVSAWGDVDNDGDLDLFLAQWGMGIPFVEGLLARPRMSSKLFVNEGGRFRDGTADWGLAELVDDEYFIGASFGDVDGDGDEDLFLSSPVRRASVLLRNEDRSRFVPTGLVRRKDSGFYAGFVDVDHDGRLDLFQGGFSDATTSTQMSVLGEGRGRFHSGHSTILHQQADGSFAERNDFFAGADMPMSTMGSSWGDLDNDGCWDFYLGTGNPEGWFVLPNLLYRGKREGRRCTGEMENVSMLSGFGNVQKGHGIVFFDFDEDGDQDLYSSLGGMWPADAWPNQLFVNDSAIAANAWVKVRLRGRETNSAGVGALLRVIAEAPDGEVFERRYRMDDKTGFGSAPYEAHVGLLDAVRLVGVEVAWPVSGCKAVYPAELRQKNLLDEADCPRLAAPWQPVVKVAPSPPSHEKIRHGDERRNGARESATGC